VESQLVPTGVAPRCEELVIEHGYRLPEGLREAIAARHVHRARS
jgi:hypothetical protein